MRLKGNKIQRKGTKRTCCRVADHFDKDELLLDLRGLLDWDPSTKTGKKKQLKFVNQKQALIVLPLKVE